MAPSEVSSDRARSIAPLPVVGLLVRRGDIHGAQRGAKHIGTSTAIEINEIRGDRMVRSTAQRLTGFGTSVFTEMSRLAVEHRAINLGQGFPDFPGPDLVKEAAARAIHADLNQYAPSHGTPRLRQAIAATFARTYGREVDPDSEVTITTGATEALQAAMLAFVDPGEEVIFFEPFYDAYPAQVVFAGGTPRAVRLQPPDWSFDPEESAAGGDAADACDPAQYASQPDRKDVYAVRIGDHRANRD